MLNKNINSLKEAMGIKNIEVNKYSLGSIGGELFNKASMENMEHLLNSALSFCKTGSTFSNINAHECALQTIEAQKNFILDYLGYNFVEITSGANKEIITAIEKFERIDGIVRPKEQILVLRLIRALRINDGEFIKDISKLLRVSVISINDLRNYINKIQDFMNSIKFKLRDEFNSEYFIKDNKNTFWIQLKSEANEIVVKGYTDNVLIGYTNIKPEQEEYLCLLRAGITKDIEDVKRAFDGF